MIYYNEWDKFAAQWLRNLIAAGHLPQGDVDERDIRQVQSSELVSYRQCHFFAGIGGWPLALKYAGWPDDSEVWTGSCPCQPLSGAGQRRGHADERHLWPAFQRLIAERRPATVFGEQVASKDGREWLAGVRADLEALGYAVGAADLCAASAGAPHIRQRLWWVADADGKQVDTANARRLYAQPSSDRAFSRLADTDFGTGGQGGALGTGRDQRSDALEGAGPSGSRWAGIVGHADAARFQERAGERSDDGAQLAAAQRASGDAFWSAFDLIPCADGKARRVEPGTFPLAHGVRSRVGRLRAYGNAIVPQVAAEFVSAFMGCRPASPASAR